MTLQLPEPEALDAETPTFPGLFILPQSVKLRPHVLYGRAPWFANLPCPAKRLHPQSLAVQIGRQVRRGAYKLHEHLQNDILADEAAQGARLHKRYDRRRPLQNAAPSPCAPRGRGRPNREARAKDVGLAGGTRVGRHIRYKLLGPAGLEQERRAHQ